DEPLLEREASRGRVEPGAEAVVGRGQERGLHPERLREARCHGGERQTGSERLRPDEMEPEVEIPELEPCLAAEGRDGFERAPGLVRAAPAALLVGEPREGVEDAVEVGRDVEPEHLQVVADVPDDRDVARRADLREAAHEPRPADAAGEDADPHVAGTSPAIASAICVRGPTRPSSRCRSSSVSTSSTRLASSTVAAGPSVRKRSALPGP